MATEIQTHVTSLLDGLGFEVVPEDPPRCGGPVRFQATGDTKERIERMIESGQTMIVDSDGSVDFE